MSVAFPETERPVFHCTSHITFPFPFPILGQEHHVDSTPFSATFPGRRSVPRTWHDVALMCGHEMAVPGALPMCIRVLIHWNTHKSQTEINHVYIRGARNLRPDRSISLASFTEVTG